MSETHTLSILHGNGPLTQKELSHRLHLEESTISRLIIDLVQTEFVYREANHQGRRENRLRLTDAGRKRVREIDRARREWLHVP